MTASKGKQAQMSRLDDFTSGISWCKRNTGARERIAMRIFFPSPTSLFSQPALLTRVRVFQLPRSTIFEEQEGLLVV